MIEHFKLVGGPMHGTEVDVRYKPADIRFEARREDNCMEQLDAGGVHVVAAEYRYIRRTLFIERQHVAFYIWEHTPDKHAEAIILHGAKP